MSLYILTSNCVYGRGKFAAHYVGVSRAPSINRFAEQPHYNGLTLLGQPLRMEHFIGGQAQTGKHFKDLDLIRDEYERLRTLPVGRMHANDED